MEYYLFYNNQTVGPMSAEQLVSYGVDENSQVSADGGEWRPLYTYPELMEVYSRNGGRANRAYSEDSKRILCGVLAILIGGLGLQYFLIGKTAAGIINIVLSICTCGLWSIVNLIQGIMILCMSDDDWERKFVNSSSTFPIF